MPKYNFHQVKGQCHNCQNNHFDTAIYKVFKEVGWFRGEDDYIGKYCKECVKAKSYMLRDNHSQPKG